MATSPEIVDDREEMRPHYDFKTMKGVVRGKYYERYRASFPTIRLEPDVAAVFKDDAAAVDAALRVYLKEHPVETIPANGSSALA